MPLIYRVLQNLQRPLTFEHHRSISNSLGSQHTDRILGIFLAQFTVIYTDTNDHKCEILFAHLL
jgi:hypothetical protein